MTRTGLSGLSGEVSGRELLDSLLRLGCSGTLLLEQQGSLLILMQSGRVVREVVLAGEPDLSRTRQRYHFEPHGSTATPRLASRYPASSLGVCRALPKLSATLALAADLIELGPLLTRLDHEHVSGYLALDAPEGHAVLLLWRGQLSAALYESGAQVRSGVDALRAAQRLRAKPGAHLSLVRLALPLVEALLGLALEEVADEGVPLSGIEVDETGYGFYRDGTLLLFIPAELVGAVGRYRSCAAPPTLALPDEPPGWETLRYGLTLRGRDALNPMTELAMAFRSRHGTLGRTLLQQLGQRRSVEEVARHLGLELSEVRPWLEQLEQEGLIQPLDDDYLLRHARSQGRVRFKPD